MRKVLKLEALGALLCALQMAAVADAKKMPFVTRDNFVSFQYSTYRGPTDASFHARLEGNALRAKTSRPHSMGGQETFQWLRFNDWDQSATLSNNQLQAFIKILNEARLSKIVGKYRDKRLADGFSEYLALTISDEQNHDQKFVIENYGKVAPRAYFTVVEAFQLLQAQKFPDLSQLFGVVTRQNFQTLTLETSGGIAGIHSLLKIKMRPSQSSIGGAMLNWSQTMGGQTAKKEAALGLKELDQLNSALNAANLPNLNGKNYQQPKLADGFGEVLTVTLQDGRKFTVQNYGDTAPAEYYALTRYLRELQRKKIETGETQ